MEFFDGKGDGDFITLRLIVDGRPFQDTCGIRILGLPEVDAAIRELCALKWTHRSRQFFSEFKLRRLLPLQLVGAAP
ncbi:hypothetical protein PA12_pgene128 (plasmid) [Pseudomonas aeruginosa]|nr:hypothetical protein PA12_pgene128 [Pseudomonas aeruginosa]